MSEQNNPLDIIVSQLDELIAVSKEDRFPQEYLGDVIRSVIDYSKYGHQNEPVSETSAATLARLKEEYVTPEYEWTLERSDVVEGAILEEAKLLLDAAAAAKHPDELKLLNEAYGGLNDMMWDYEEATRRIDSNDLSLDVSEALEWRRLELEDASDLNLYQSKQAARIAKQAVEDLRQRLAGKNKNAGT